jgi:hypothetical protein
MHEISQETGSQDGGWCTVQTGMVEVITASHLEYDLDILDFNNHLSARSRYLADTLGKCFYLTNYRIT